MVVALLAWIYLTIVCYAAGHFSLKAINRLSSDAAVHHVSITTIVGLVVVTILSSIVSLLFRLNWEANLFFLLFAIGYLVRSRSEFAGELRKIHSGLKRVKAATWFLFAASLLVAMVYAAMPSKNFDFGLYHMTTIKWISNYAAVPGLGNIHGRLAFNSSWYVLSALFSFSFLKPFAFFDVSPYLYILVSVYGAHGLQQILDGRFNMVELTKACFVLPTAVLLAFLDAPATDLASNYFIWLIFTFFLIKVEEKTIGTFDAHTVLIFLFSAFVCTVKLSAIPVMVLPAYLLLRQFKPMGWTGVAALVVLCLVTIAPWVARNIILSGYLVYPFDKIDIFNVDWKMPIEEVRLESAIVKQYGKYPQLPITQEAVEYSLDQAGAPFMSWFPAWFMHKAWMLKLILVMLPVGAIGLLTALVVDGVRHTFRNLSFDLHYILMFGLLLGGTLFCFYLGPSLRYSYGFILFFNILLFAVIFRRLIGNRFGPASKYVLTGLVIVALLLPLYRCVTIVARDILPGGNLVFPHVYANQELETYSYNGFDIYKPKEGYFCWDAPLPCAPLPPSGKVHMRTGAIQDGYKFVGEY